ncbi:tetratricopeptide repeat protein [uncultured Psychroserpens sp.]|uniref:tetratricopeptide repeat protein n=1 Tax=uncultured Psychroserpens sp. TaxID=255436 RepID=UPI0026311FAF|nr:tetratricopeptide repeat protein [uncultured Psychroserpens sp.]
MKFPLLITFTLLINIGYSQTQDSISNTILQKIRTAQSDSVRIDLEIQLAYRTCLFDVDTTRTIVNNVLETIKQKGYQTYYYKQQKADALNFLGMFDQEQGHRDKALSNYLKALDICETIQDSTGVGLTLNNLGKFYIANKDYTKSKHYFRKAIAIREILKDENFLAISYQMLANAFYYDKQNDSALIYTNKVKAIPMLSKPLIVAANDTKAAIYYSTGELDKAIKIYKENIAIYKAVNHLRSLSTIHTNVAALYVALNNYQEALPHLDSAIFNAKKVKDIGLLADQYRKRSTLYSKQKKYAEALEDYKIYKTYFDSIYDTEKAKRVTALELNYKFEKEKLADELVLQSETSKRRLYLLLFILTVFFGAIVLLHYRENIKNRLSISKSKLEKEQLEKLKSELVLVTREKELKRAVVENSLRQDVLHKTLESVKNIIGLENQEKRNYALQTLWATLLSEKSSKTTSQSLQLYLDKVNMDFKIILNTKFPKLNEKEKAILSFMTLGLNTNQISELQNTTVSAIKSIRHRIRKKLGLDSSDDIIEFIKSTNEINT